MPNTTEPDEREEPQAPDRIAINPAFAARCPLSDRRIGDVEYVRVSVAAPQGDALKLLDKIVRRVRFELRDSPALLSHPAWKNLTDEADQLLASSPVSPSPIPDAEQKAHYETAHEARYTMTHAVHPDIVVLWFLALKSHWFDDPNNMFFGMREQAKAYLYKWVETGELADDRTTLEIATAMKFGEWLASSWTAATPSTSVARQAATEIAYEMNGGDRKDLTYPKPWRDLFDDPSIANEAAFAAWVEAIILKYISPVGEELSSCCGARVDHPEGWGVPRCLACNTGCVTHYHPQGESKT